MTRTVYLSMTLPYHLLNLIRHLPIDLPRCCAKKKIKVFLDEFRRINSVLGSQ